MTLHYITLIHMPYIYIILSYIVIDTYESGIDVDMDVDMNMSHIQIQICICACRCRCEHPSYTGLLLDT